MAEFLTTAGDFEMQVACTESLVRIVKRADRSTLAHQWFTDNDFAGAFMQIKDETFEAVGVHFMLFLLYFFSFFFKYLAINLKGN